MQTRNSTPHSRMVLEKWSSYDNNSERTKHYRNFPLITGEEIKYIQDAIENGFLSAENKYSLKSTEYLENYTSCKKVILTTSCTDALEMAAILIDTKPGDEIIMAAFNFVSAPNAFVLRGAKIIFVDIDPSTMNIQPEEIEKAISPKTKAIVVMHYGGVACEMNQIAEIANKNNLFIIEDAAHSIGSFYNGKHLGTLGHLGTLSFHDTKNIQCGEGGALLINDEQFLSRAKILHDKGTNRNEFINGHVKKYTWVDIGSSYGLGELNAAFLFAQLQNIEAITQKRKFLWEYYFKLFSKLPYLELPENCGNGHIFYVKMKNKQIRENIIQHLHRHHISALSHYEALHSSTAGKIYSEFIGRDEVTTNDSERLLRLPLYFEMSVADIDNIFQQFKHCYELSDC